METARLKKIVPYVVIFLAAVYFYHLASKVEYVAKSGALGPDFWPKVILALTMVACLYEVVKNSFFSRGDRSAQKIEEAESVEDGVSAEAPQKSYTALLLIGTSLTMAYAYFVEVLGFLLSTFLYLSLFMFVGRYRKIWVIVTSSAAGTLILAFVFIRLVYISLPYGHGPFSAISFFILKLMGIK